MELFRIIEFLWTRKFPVLALTSVFLVLGFVYAKFSKPMYVAKAVIAAKDRSNDGMGAKLAQLGGLGGFMLGQSSNAGLVKIEVAAKSYELAEQVTRENGMLPMLFPDRWDPTKRTWKKSFLDRPPPTIKQGSLALMGKHMKASINPLNGTVTLTAVAGDSVLSARLVELYLVALNKKLQREVILDAKRNNEYLEGQLSVAIDPRIRAKIEELMAYEIERTMLASFSYFDVLEKPFVPLVSEGPKKKSILAASLVMGFIVSCMIVMVSGAVQAHRRSPQPRGNEN